MLLAEAAGHTLGWRAGAACCVPDQLGSTVGEQNPECNIAARCCNCDEQPHPSTHSCSANAPPTAAAAAGCCRLHGLCLLQEPCRLRDGLLSTCGQKPRRWVCSLSVCARMRVSISGGAAGGGRQPCGRHGGAPARVIWLEIPKNQKYTMWGRHNGVRPFLTCPSSLCPALPTDPLTATRHTHARTHAHACSECCGAGVVCGPQAW